MISALSAATSSVHSLETSRLNLQMIQLPGMGRVRSGHVSLILKQTCAIEASVGVWPILHGLREGISWWLEEVVHRAYVRAQAFRPVSDLPAASPCDAGSYTLLFLDRI